MVWKRVIAVFLAAAFLSGGAQAQVRRQADKDSDRRVERVRELYSNDMFSAVREEIISIMDENRLSPSEESELATYFIISSIRLNSPNIDALMDEYRERYRYAPEYMGVQLMYAGYYFDRKEYTRALSVLEQIEYALLSRNDKSVYLFYRSFCQLRVGRIDDARRGFDRLLAGGHTKYTVSSTYYRGYIAYVDKDFAKAVRLLSSISGDAHYGAYCGYYILESKLMSGDYAYVVENGAAVSSAVGKDMRPKVARMVSQAYYRMGRPEEARKWFDSYTSSGVDISRKDSYYLGIISYSTGSYYEAVEALKKVLTAEDSLAQSACMHIANSYIELKNKHEALAYYKRACEMTFDASIREEAFFNYAKLSFDVNSDITAFEDYLQVYPGTTRSDEIYSYIATSCLLAKKYRSAITALNNIRRLTPEMDVNLQKAAFFRAKELFDRGAYGGAVTDFNIALRHSAYNPTLGLLTRFWLAEAYYRTGKTDEALRLNDYLYQNSSFRKFAEYPLMLFSQGYNYFSKEEYEKAIDWFYLFLETHGEDMDLIIESKLRIGDAFFMLKDYSKAASVYEEVAMVDYQDESVVYAAYQCALCCGLLSDMNKKTAILETVMDRGTDAAVYPAAVYELGRTYVQTGHSDKAERCFKYLLNEVNDPVYNVKAMLELGMLYSNAGNYDTALSYLTRIVEETPLSEDTENALAVIESIYTTLNRPEEYFAYLDRVGMSATKTADEKEVMMFNASEQIYLSGDYPAAERSLRAFISRYPDGQKTPLAYFYLGETLSELGRKEAAASAYAEVMDKGEGSSVEISTLHYAEICYDLEQYDKAGAAYEALYAGARIENNRYEALVGMMRSYFMNEKYRMAIDAAAKVLASQAIMDDDRLYAQYVTAKSSLSLGRRTEALPLLRSLSGQPFTPQGAEAYYLLIQDTYDAGNFEEVENLVYAFSDSQTNQLYWLAKSFIVLGDSFAEREEWEQAEATFRSIKDEYEPQGPKDDVLDQVNMRIDRLNKITEQQ